MTTERFSLKDHLFNLPKVQMLADQVSQIFPDFESESFVQIVVSQFPRLELKERIHHITQCLHRFLPENYLEALQIIVDALPPILNPDREDDDFGDFIYSPYGEFVARYGCRE
jgi:hypothetical protein